MNHASKPIAALVLLASLAGSAWSQGARNVELLDYSTRSLISEEAAKKVMGELIPEKLWKIYPASKYVFISQVEGGITPAGACAVTARVMLMPLTPTAKAVLFRPQKTATSFDALPSATVDQCQAAATQKLKEATSSVVAALVKI